MPMYHVGQQMSQSVPQGSSAQIRESVDRRYSNNIERPVQMASFPRNEMRPSFSVPEGGYNGFGAPPQNLDFKIDGLPDHLQPKGLLNPLAFGK